MKRSNDDSSKQSDNKKSNENPYANMPSIYGGRIIDNRPYSEMPPVYDPNFYKKPIEKNECKERITIKPTSDDASVIGSIIKSEKNVLNVENIGFGYYSVLTPFTLDDKSKLDDLITHLKDTYALDEVYHDKVVGIINWSKP